MLARGKAMIDLTWYESENCLANPTFQPVAAGGDGNDIQFWFVGIDPTLKVSSVRPVWLTGRD